MRPQRGIGSSSTGRGRCLTARITAPSCGFPRRDSNGTPPGARTRHDADRTDRFHCRSSKATAAPGDHPAAPDAISPIRSRNATAPKTRPSGIAVGAITTIARIHDPANSAVHARDHATAGDHTAACHAPSPATRYATANAAIIGTHHTAATTRRRGGHPDAHAAIYDHAPASTSGHPAASSPSTIPDTTSHNTSRAAMASSQNRRYITTWRRPRRPCTRPITATLRQPPHLNPPRQQPGSWPRARSATPRAAGAYIQHPRIPHRTPG